MTFHSWLKENPNSNISDLVNINYNSYKLNKCVMLLLLSKYDIDNFTESVDPLTLEHIENKNTKSHFKLIKHWTDYQLGDLSKYYHELEDRCNKLLVKRWKEENGLEVKTLSEFVRKYQGNFFTRKQLISFFRLVGTSNPSKSADNFKARNRIEYFSLNDIKAYFKMLAT